MQYNARDQDGALRTACIVGGSPPRTPAGTGERPLLALLAVVKASDTYAPRHLCRHVLLREAAGPGDGARRRDGARRCDVLVRRTRIPF